MEPGKTRKFVRWLYPGMRVKRWLLLAVLGILLISLGMSLVLYVPSFRGFYAFWRRFVFAFLGQYHLLVPFGLFWIVGGAALIVWGLQRMNRSIIGALAPEREKDAVEVIFKKRQLAKGPHVVALGGGHGLYTLLHGLKEYTANITAVVTVFDDGGSSGRIRQDMGVLPPGDIRNCLIALADTEPLMRDLFQYRFGEDNELKGHNFGNLFIAALTRVTGDFQRAILESSKVLAVRGRVLPTTLENVLLKAECEDGTVVCGESNVGSCGKRIKRISLDPPSVTTTPEVLQALEEADLIVLGPGSLYTSVLCNLAVEEVRQAILRSQAPLVFVCNVTTQPGETDGYTFFDHLQAVFQFLPPERVNYVLVNGEKPEEEVLQGLLASGVEPVLAEGVEWDFPGKVLEAPLLSPEYPTRHDPEKLAQALVGILLEEKSSWGLYFALHTRDGFKNLKIVRLVGRLRQKAFTTGESGSVASKM